MDEREILDTKNCAFISARRDGRNYCIEIDSFYFWQEDLDEAIEFFQMLKNKLKAEEASQ